MKTHLLVFGRHPALSLAELRAFAEAEHLSIVVTEVSSDVVLVSGIPDEGADTLLTRLAGTIKIAILLGTHEASSVSDVKAWTEVLLPHMKNLSLRAFGLSYYGLSTLLPSASVQERIALTIKKTLRQGEKIRWVSGKGKVLSSVQVDKNKMLGTTGSEIIIAVQDEQIHIAKTIAVQPFEDWGDRDFGRPARDARSGMLPPKLARLMVNLLGIAPDGVLLDPFCGSGTVLMEARLSGWTKIIGSDKSEKAVDDSRKNMEWLKHERQTDIAGSQFFVRSVSKLVSDVPEESVTAIVTEPDLGPSLHQQPTEQEALRIALSLVPLYREAFATFAKLLRPGGRIVMVLPRWMAEDNEEVRFPLGDVGIPVTLEKRHLLNPDVEKSTAFLYYRPEQFVAREIVSFEKK